MKSIRRSKTWIGIVVGLACAVVTPFLALAQHDSGEASGDDPIQAVAAHGATTVGTASFRIPKPQAAHQSIDLSISSYSPSMNTYGAHIDEDRNTTTSTCGKSCLWVDHFTWAQCLNAQPCTTENIEMRYQWLAASPFAPVGGSAGASGELTAPSWIDATGRCSFDVQWTDFGTPRVSADPNVKTGPHGGSAFGEVLVGRSATAEITVSCPTTTGSIDTLATSFDAGIYNSYAGTARAIVAPEV